MEKYKIFITNKNLEYTCKENQNLLESLEATHKAHFMVGCRQGGCGFCRIKILSGTYTIGLMSREHISAEDQKSGITLACRTFPTSDVILEFIGLKK